MSWSAGGAGHSLRSTFKIYPFMAKERVLITVKTYPTLSRKYGETVCTAALRPDGTWMRIYPVPFRRLDEEQQYKKFDWMEAEFIKSKSDPRPESRHPADIKQ